MIEFSSLYLLRVASRFAKLIFLPFFPLHFIIRQGVELNPPLRERSAPMRLR
jgi:hypothetical protein